MGKLKTELSIIRYVIFDIISCSISFGVEKNYINSN